MITFTLKKPLPKGAQLRATSLHAMGRVEYKGAQYNRSGLNYIRDIDKYIRSSILKGWCMIL